MATMLAARVNAFGGPEVLTLEQVPIPEPKEGEVLLAIRAASINPVDYKTRAGKYPGVTAADLPRTLGRDGSGVVAKLGPGVSDVKEGDAIYAMIGRNRGTWAEYVILKADERVAKPKTLDHAHAGATPLAALTAWQALFDHGGVQAGQRVLIHAASGGVGHFATQFAKLKGAHVIATASGDGIAFARAHGADEVIDYKTQRFDDVVKDVDVVFDTMAGEVQDRSWAVLKKGGILVTILGQPNEEKAKAHGVRAARFLCAIKADQLAEIGRLIDDGKVRVAVQQSFALADMLKAQELAERGPIRGKIVIENR